MIKKTGITLFLLIFLISFTSFSSATTITVGSDEEADFSDISQAVNSALNGDTISIAAGTYTINESIRINNSIRIIGQGVDNTYIFSEMNLGSVGIFVLKANNAEIRNLSISDLTKNSTGILLASDNCIISDIKIYDTYTAIYMIDSSGVKILNNQLINNQDSGIRSYILNETSENNIIQNNIISNNTVNGIVVFDSKNFQIKDNTISNNNIAGISSSFSSNCVFSKNTFENNSFYSILLVRADNNSIKHNIISGSNQGIASFMSENNTINSNTISNCKIGINVSIESKNEIVEDNTFQNNEEDVFGISQDIKSKYTSNKTIFYVLFFVVISSFVLLLFSESSIFRYCKEKDKKKYEELGEPTIFSTSNFKATIYLLKLKTKKIKNEKLKRFVKSLKLNFITFLLSFILLIIVIFIDSL